MLNFKLFIATITGLFLLISAGCVTIGQPLPLNYAQTIVIGQTSQSEIEQVLGSPDRVGLDSGNQTMTYLYYRVGLFVQPTTTDLTIVFDKSGKVQSYVFNTNQQ